MSPNRSFWIKWIWEKKFISSCRIIYKTKNKETSPCKFLIYFYFSYPVCSPSISLGTAIVSVCFYRAWKIFNENTVYFSAFKPRNVFKLHFLECIDCVEWLCTVTVYCDWKTRTVDHTFAENRKQYEGIYRQVKVEIEILLGKTTNIQTRYVIDRQRNIMLRFVKNRPKFKF